MATAATFSAATGQLSVFGDEHKNTITVNRNVAGNLLVNDGTIDINGGIPTVANTNLINVFGQAGDDIITLDEAHGALPPLICSAVPATTRSPVAPATINYSARMATTPSLAKA